MPPWFKMPITHELTRGEKNLTGIKLLEGKYILSRTQLTMRVIMIVTKASLCTRHFPRCLYEFSSSSVETGLQRG